MSIEQLESRVAELLAHSDQLRKHIESHDFSLAAMEAKALVLYCEGANKIANRLADAS